MCDELGDTSYMQDYVTSAGKTSLCSVSTSKGCSTKELTFMDTWKVKDMDALSKEVTRLTELKSGKLTNSAAEWIQQRIAIIQQIISNMKSEL